MRAHDHPLAASTSAGMVDLHSHLLPGIDDGAKDLGQALNMARQAVADGIVTAVVTPHHLNGQYWNSATTVREHCANLREQLIAHAIPLEILPGAECHLVPELPAALAAGTVLTVADRGRAVLVELPVHHVPLGATGILESILALGLQPIIAHPERNAQLARDSEPLEEWVAMGCLGQGTAQSCTGRFGPHVREALEHMLHEGLIHLLASDAHRDSRRVPELRPGRAVIEHWLGAAAGRLLTEVNPRALALGQPVDIDALEAALPMRRSGLWQWLQRWRA